MWSLKRKLVLALSVLAIIIAASFVVQYLATSGQSAGPSNLSMDETFSSKDFTYGPQAWAPGGQQIQIMPGVTTGSSNTFYIMFVDLNATPDVLNVSNPAVEVNYSFTNLQGTAAFHVYGYSKADGYIGWTNMVEGSGSSGFYVTSSSSSSTSKLQGPSALSGFNDVYVKVANSNGAKFNSFNNNTYYVNFKSPTAGLGAIHITDDPKVPDGQIVYTSNVTGTFYLTNTGNSLKDDFILMVAVNGTLSSNFALNIKSSI